MRFKPISAEKEAFIIAHKDMKRCELAEAAGVSRNTVWNVLRKHGLPHRHADYSKSLGEERVAEIKDYIREHFATTRTADIAERFGIPKYMVSAWAKKMGLTKTPEYIAESYRLNGPRIKAALTPQKIAKRTATYHRHRRMELMRIQSGLPRKTRMPFAALPFKTTIAMKRLCWRFNYFRGEDRSKRVVYYDEETHIIPDRFVEHYKKKYGIQFIDCREHGEEAEET